jgi:hypothetical protein
MAEDATAVNDAPITDAPASAPVETSEKVENLDSFDLDESDFKDDPSDSDEEGQTGDEAPDKPQPAPDQDEDADTETDQKAEDTEEPTDQKETDDKPSKEDKRQDFIRNLVNERNELRKQVADLNSSIYEARTPEQLQQEINPDTNEYYTALEARVIASEEKQALRDYNDQVADAQLSVQTDARNVIQDFPWADESSKDFNKELAPAVDEMLARNFIRDPNTEQTDKDGNRIPGTGQIVGTHLPTYQLYKLIDDAVKIGKTNGELQGQKATKKMMATADSISSAGPAAPKRDAFADAFDREFDK